MTIINTFIPGETIRTTGTGLRGILTMDLSPSRATITFENTGATKTSRSTIIGDDEITTDITADELTFKCPRMTNLRTESLTPDSSFVYDKINVTLDLDGIFSFNGKGTGIVDLSWNRVFVVSDLIIGRAAIAFVPAVYVEDGVIAKLIKNNANRYEYNDILSLNAYSDTLSDSATYVYSAQNSLDPEDFHLIFSKSDLGAARMNLYNPGVNT